MNSMPLAWIAVRPSKSKRHAHLAYSHLLGARQSTEAREALAAGREIIARLVAQFPDHAQWKRDLGWFDRQIAALKN